MGEPPVDRRPRIAVVCEGNPADPTEWSGTPYGILSALRDLDVEVVPVVGAPQGPLVPVLRDAAAIVNARPHRIDRSALTASLRESRLAAPYTSVFGKLGSVVARRQLRRAGRVDAVVQIGTSYIIDHPRVVTFEDMTVRQAVAFEQYAFPRLRPRQIENRVRVQARTYQKATAVAAATPWAAASIRDDYGVPEDKILTVGLGRNHEVPHTDRDWSTPRFLFVGHDWVRKNGTAVVEAFRSVRSFWPSATLDLVGGHPHVGIDGVREHGPLRLGNAREAAQLNALFATSTCLVMPSSFEAAGIVYIEAAAAGVPSIGTRRGGAGCMIGAGGTVVDPFDMQALRDAMLTMADPVTARALGHTAHQRSSSFTWTQVAGRLLRPLGIDRGGVLGVPW